MRLKGKRVGILVGPGYSGLLPATDQGAFSLIVQTEAHHADATGV